MPAAVPALISGGSAIAGGLLNRGGSKSSGTSTSTTTPTYTDAQQGINDMLGNILRQMGKKPQIDKRLQTEGRNAINTNYDNVASRLDSNFAARGFGDSGGHNLNTVGLEINRQKGLGDLEGSLYKDARDRQMEALALAAQFGRASGQTTTGATTQTNPGMGVGQAIGGMLPGIGGNIATMLWSRHMMGQGPGGSPNFNDGPSSGLGTPPWMSPGSGSMGLMMEPRASDSSSTWSQRLSSNPWMTQRPDGQFSI